jgi:P27 family predicted phage terminase small subunit
MGRRGPAPEPTVLRVLRGNPSKTPINDLEPQPSAFGIETPDWLEGAALDKWNQMLPRLLSMKVMTVADQETLARYCALWEQWKKNYDFVRQGGDVLVIRDEAGTVKFMQQTPQATAMKQLATMLLTIEQQFGMTPSSRTQVQVHQTVDDDPLSTFVARRGRA